MFQTLLLFRIILTTYYLHFIKLGCIFDYQTLILIIMSNEQNNKLIAEFMGLKVKYHKKFDEYIINDLPLSCHSYNTSWDWLMPVIDKIESTKIYHEEIKETTPWFNASPYCLKLYYYDTMCCYVYNLDGQPIKFYYNNLAAKNKDNYCKSKIQAFYQVAIEFIEWYNKSKL